MVESTQSSFSRPAIGFLFEWYQVKIQIFYCCLRIALVVIKGYRYPDINTYGD